MGTAFLVLNNGVFVFTGLMIYSHVEALPADKDTSSVLQTAKRFAMVTEHSHVQSGIPSFSGSSGKGVPPARFTQRIDGIASSFPQQCHSASQRHSTSQRCSTSQRHSRKGGNPVQAQIAP